MLRLATRAISFLAPGRRIYVDLGANHGDTVKAFRDENPEVLVFAFEPNADLAASLRSRFALAEGVTIIEAAAWTADTELPLFMGIDSDQSSTLMQEKKFTPEWRVDYDVSHKVRAIDFDQWLRRKFSRRDHITVKMDIEGAEYKVLAKMIRKGSLRYVKEIRVEWHWDRYPSIAKSEHDEVRTKVASLTKLVDWH